MVPKLILIMPLFFASIVWAYWIWNTARSTAQKIVLLPGHQKAEITYFTMMGKPKVAFASVNNIRTGVRPTPMVKDSTGTEEEIKNARETRNVPLQIQIGLIEIGWIDCVYVKDAPEDLEPYLDTPKARAFVEEEDEEYIPTLLEKYQNRKSVRRFLVQPSQAKTLSVPDFFKFLSPHIPTSPSLDSQLDK